MFDHVHTVVCIALCHSLPTLQGCESRRSVERHKAERPSALRLCITTCISRGFSSNVLRSQFRFVCEFN